MTLSHVFDAATPPAKAPAGCTGVLGYIGGARAYRTWTLENWQRFASLHQFPCWVPYGTENPADNAREAAAAAVALGWEAHDVIAQRGIICDLETLKIPEWYHSWAVQINTEGFFAIAYGSASTILANKATNNWVAAYNGEDTLPSGGIHGHQYAADVAFGGTEIDLSVVDEWLFQRGGVGPRH